MENILAPGGAPRRYDNELIRLELVFKHDGRGRECGRDHLTAFRLLLLGVPLPWTLGPLTGSLNFIPNLGPIIAVVPAVILAFAQSPRQALYTLALYVILQSLDGYVFTPLVQRRTVALPPALTITAQVALGVLLGGSGARDRQDALFARNARPANHTDVGRRLALTFFSPTTDVRTLSVNVRVGTS